MSDEMIATSARTIRICAVDEVDENDTLQVEVDEDDIPTLAVYRLEGDEIYVSEDRCSHGNASLADEGYLEGHIIECTWHEGKFDIRTGEPTAMPCDKPIKVYPVTIKDGDVYITA
jgi:p-cumate 2,3-dioxygenase ferredoxin component